MTIPFRSFCKNIFNSRFGALAAFYMFFLALSFGVRVILLIFSFDEVSAYPWELFKVFFVGMFFDTVAASYFTLGYLAAIVFVPSKLANTRVYEILTYLSYTLGSLILIFSSFSEYFFWDEFNVRFNFIAVDYLIYTTEVIGNILQSYPIPLLVLMILTLSTLTLWVLLKSKIVNKSVSDTIPFKRRFMIGTGFLLIPVFDLLFVTQSLSKISEDSYNNELAKNGIYSIFEAYKNNQLDYNAFYPVKNPHLALSDTRKLLQGEGRFYESDSTDLQYSYQPDSIFVPKNIMFITIESLSGEFMSYLGSTQGKVTPFLDSLSEKSLFFTKIFATGTRTVRGLEALTLSVPPTPGTSIVRRPDNDSLFSLGSVFSNLGYQNTFLYGGNGFFDNMNAFFEGNGFKIVDKKKMSKEEISFENAWGTCDQDVYRRAIKEADASYASGKIFLNFILTTSNHRPYTFPKVAVDLKEGTRAAGVRYSDFALQEFFRNAASKPWFENTVFVIVGDHCASSAGKTDLPINRYRIPAIIYNAGSVQPQKIDKLCSQIDILPTLLSLLHVKYASTFFGKNILSMKPEEERAFIATYQQLGYVKQNQLIVLNPRTQPQVFQYDPNTFESTPVNIPSPLSNEAISLYQSAEYLFVNRMDKMPMSKFRESL
ncbi:MAG: sulfatase-like hydrolase/transferase [Bacteroidales bacterium]|nr:sulfatase-like hydrolase/transferase [Bacteroidales bacterium]